MSALKLLAIGTWLYMLVVMGDRLIVNYESMLLTKDFMYYEGETKRLKQENNDLENQIADHTSLRYAKEVADSEGFKVPKPKQMIISR